MSKTKAKQIQPPIESLHKQSKQIRDQEVANEDENRELRRVTVFYEEMMVTMETKIASMIDDGLLKLSDADVH